MAKKAGGYRPIHQKRICAYCEKPFIAKASKTKYCSNPHKANCPICNKEFYHNPIKLLKGVTCSKECQMVKTEKTNLEKYGKKNVLQIKSVREKIKQTNLKRYGHENPFGSKEIRDKIEDTIMEKYGYKSSFETAEVQEKIKQTNLRKYGHENPFGSKTIQEKIKKTNLEKFGVEYTGSLEYMRKINSDRLKDPKIQKKMKDSYNKKYKDNPELYKEIIKKSFITGYKNKGITNPEEWHEFKNWILNNQNKSLIEISEYFNQPIGLIKSKIAKDDLQYLFEDYYKQSAPELEFFNELIKFIPKNEILIKNRKTITPFEFDFFIPKFNIAIEINPTFTHKYITNENEIGVTSKKYHYSKFKLAEDKNIELISVFEWEQIEPVIKFIKSKIKNQYKTIYARKCLIKDSEYTNKHKDFLRKNHLLGDVKNKKGSFVKEIIFNDALIGLGLFFPTKNKSIYELKRLAFKDNIKIIGGASKILKSVFSNEIKEIITYSDNNYGTGNVYKKVGFELIEEITNSLTWAHDKKKIYINNLSLVKLGADKLLKNFPGYEPIGTGESLPKNDEILKQYGFVPIYDCGYRKWSYKKD